MGGGGGEGGGAGDTSRFHFRIPGFKQLCNSSHLGGDSDLEGSPSHGRDRARASQGALHISATC